MPEAKLTIAGREYSNWTSVAVTRSMEALASTFQLELTERWTERGDREAIPVVEGLPCRLTLDDEVVVPGHVVESRIAYDATSHSLSATGASTTGDLVDCAAIYEAGKGQWLNQGLEQIAKDICRPFGIAVALEVDVGKPFPSFRLNDGETAFEALERAARMRHVLLTTGKTGGLVITRAGAHRTATVIEYGVNAFRGGRSGSWRERFSTYVVKGQGPGDDQNAGAVVAGPSGTATDAGVTRYRPTIIHAETIGTADQFRERAEWERNVRAGRAQRLTYTVSGWRCAEGMWRPNTLARVKDRKLKVDTELLVVTVRAMKGPQGTVTELELSARKALTAQPIIPSANSGLSFFGTQP